MLFDLEFALQTICAVIAGMIRFIYFNKMEVQIDGNRAHVGEIGLPYC